MNQEKHAYTNSDEWRKAAMSRPDCISKQESAVRQKTADIHNLQRKLSDPDIFLDQQLYILGKMDMDEYQNYLLFKHSKQG